MPTKPTHVVETISSYARRRDGAVAVILHLPELATGAGEGDVRLASGRRNVSARATVKEAVPGARVEAELPAEQLPPGVWTVSVKLDGDTSFQSVQARLLTSGQQPIALLTGPRGGAGLTAGAPVTGRRRVAAQAGRVLDRVLAVLPPEQARRYRSTLRKTARRVLR